MCPQRTGKARSFQMLQITISGTYWKLWVSWDPGPGKLYSMLRSMAFTKSKTLWMWCNRLQLRSGGILSHLLYCFAQRFTNKLIRSSLLGCHYFINSLKSRGISGKPIAMVLKPRLERIEGGGRHDRIVLYLGPSTWNQRDEFSYRFQQYFPPSHATSSTAGEEVRVYYQVSTLLLSSAHESSVTILKTRPIPRKGDGNLGHTIVKWASGFTSRGHPTLRLVSTSIPSVGWMICLLFAISEQPNLFQNISKRIAQDLAEERLHTLEGWDSWRWIFQATLNAFDINFMTRQARDMCDYSLKVPLIGDIKENLYPK